MNHLIFTHRLRADEAPIIFEEKTFNQANQYQNEVVTKQDKETLKCEEIIIEKTEIRAEEVLKKNKFDFKRGYEADEHLLNLKELALKYGTQISEENPNQTKGLATNKIPELTQKYGKNMLSPTKKTPEIIKFLKHGLNGLNLQLTAVGILSCSTYDPNENSKIDLFLGVFLFILVFFDMVC